MTGWRARLALFLLAVLALEASAGDVCTPDSLDGDLAKPHGTLRFATFNVYLNRSEDGELVRDLRSADDQVEGSDAQVKAVAEIIQRVRPDVLLLNEFDYDADGLGIALLQSNFLAVSQGGSSPIHYPFVYSAPSNTGVDTGFDLDGDGRTGGPGDAHGYGAFPGQYAMVLLSRLPIEVSAVRTFRKFRWQQMPGALFPDDPSTSAAGDYFDVEARRQLRLSSKSHWDIPVLVGAPGHVVHVLAAHPTPPVFDGPEDRNGRRNHDEIRLWADYVRSEVAGAYLIDDRGGAGWLGRKRFVILGDYNADPHDGDSTDGAINQLLEHPAINTSIQPGSHGGLGGCPRRGSRQRRSHR